MKAVRCLKSYLINYNDMNVSKLAMMSNVVMLRVLSKYPATEDREAVFSIINKNIPSDPV